MKKCLLLLAVVAVAVGCTNSMRMTQMAPARVEKLDEMDDFWSPDPYLGEKLMLYPLNRVLDLCDLASVSAGLGPDVQANLHATRALQVGAGASSTARAGYNTCREIGLYRQTGWEASLLSLSWENYSKTNVRSWDSVKEIEHKANGLSQPGYPIYRDNVRDYWGIGGHLPLLLASVEAEVHPVELVDLVLGFFMVDLRGDDLGVKSGENRMLE